MHDCNVKAPPPKLDQHTRMTICVYSIESLKHNPTNWNASYKDDDC